MTTPDPIQPALPDEEAAAVVPPGAVPSAAVPPGAADPVAAAAAALAAAGYVVEPVGDPARRTRRTVGALQLALVLVALLAGAALFLSGYSLGSRTAATPGTPASDAALFRPFWDVWSSINGSYVGTIDRAALVQGAIDGMIKALGDPFSSYMSPADLKKAREDLGGQFEGIGAQMEAKPTDASQASCAPLGPTCRLVVVTPLPSSPAEKAGLAAGDVVTAVDGASLDGQTLDVAVAKVRGPRGTPVVLTIVRGTKAPFDLSIVRDVIVQEQVVSRDLANGTVRYIEVSTFSDRAATDFVTSLKAGLAQGEKSIIIDLRDNPGGYVTAARTIASQFIAAGPIFWEERADGTQTPTDAQPGGVATDPSIRVAVLVNKGSASASEIVSGALQDTKRAILVGETTYGKGTIQQWLDLTDNSGGFRLTIAKWLTPDKRWIHKIGLSPDVVVSPDAGASTPTGDPYIDAALARLGGTGTIPFPRLARAA